MRQNHKYTRKGETSKELIRDSRECYSQALSDSVRPTRIYATTVWPNGTAACLGWALAHCRSQSHKNPGQERERERGREGDGGADCPSEAQTSDHTNDIATQPQRRRRRFGLAAAAADDDDGRSAPPFAELAASNVGRDRKESRVPPPFQLARARLP